MNYGLNNDFGEAKEMAYDLRQGLAFVLIDTLRNIKLYREERDYKNWFEELDGLFIDICMKLKDTEKKEFNNKVKELNKAIEKEPQAYLDKEIENEKIYILLKEMNIWLLEKMEKYKMFGSKGEAEGLV